MCSSVRMSMSASSENIRSNGPGFTGGGGDGRIRDSRRDERFLSLFIKGYLGEKNYGTQQHHDPFRITPITRISSTGEMALSVWIRILSV